MAAERLCSIPNCSNTRIARGFCRGHYSRWKQYGDPTKGPLVPIDRRECSVPDCHGQIRTKGLCSLHYQRVRHHGDPLADMPARTDEGDPLKFLFNALQSEADDCIVWPYTRGQKGYGQVRYKGKAQQCHRLICEMAHGEPPSAIHQAAHNCGKGHIGCINPRHLYWATPQENTLDRIGHGTWIQGQDASYAKLTEANVIDIRHLAGTMRHIDIAALYGVSRSAVGAIIRRKRWKHVP